MSSFRDKLVNQALGYKPLPSYDARPLEGPGRWAEVVPGVILYTDDKTKLFVKGSSNDAPDLLTLIVRAARAGESATSAFERLRRGAPVITGDLSQLK